MTRTVVLGEPPAPLAEWLERRRELGQDVFDEVWQGHYHVAPAAHAWHGDVDEQVAAALRPRARRQGLWPSGPVNIGEPEDYRVPDRVYLRHRAGVVFVPTAEIVVEIVSLGDESYEKLSFYLARGVAEVLIVDPSRRSVQWYARSADAFERTAGSALLELTEVDLAAEIDWPAA